MGTNDTLLPPREAQSSAQPEPGLGRPSPTIAYAVRTPGDALHGAAEIGDLAGITRILQASPDCVDARNARGRTPLHVAALSGRNDIVKHLLQCGADLNARSGWKYTPLIFAAESAHPDVIVTLVRAGAHLEARTAQGNTALHRAVLRERNNPDTVYVLVVFGADVNTKNDGGDTALYTSLDSGKDANAMVLCAFGADPHVKSSRGDSAADLAKTRQRTGSYEPGVNITRVISTWTPEDSIQPYRHHLLRFVRKPEDMVMDLLAILCWASGKGQKPGKAIASFVLQLCGDKAGLIVESAEMPRGWKPLHHAAAGGESDIAGMLLSHGAAVDAVTLKHKWTPLLLAADKGRQRTVARLLENGADILAKTHEGKTAFELARDGRHRQTLQILGEHATRVDDHVRQQEAVERFNQAAFSLGRSDGGELVPRRPEGSRSRSPRTNIGPPRRVSAQEFQGLDNNNFLKPNATVDHESQGSRDSSPSGLSGDAQNIGSGSFDGGLYSLPSDSSTLSQSSAFDTLINVWDYFDYKQRRDRAVKIAILDTGLDICHSDFNHSRVLRFRNAQPVRAEGEPRQRDRVRAWKDFTAAPTSAETNKMVDLDGHGTQVAGLIFRLAPRADLYVARICEGNVSRGGGVAKDSEPSANPFKWPRPDVAAAAIEWAIRQGVDIINLSFGFSSRLRGPLKDALKKAAQRNILVFAAMSNDGNNNPNGAAWPANDSDLTIGVHSCKVKGRRSSDFTPPPVPGLHNFMVEGERVLTHWPESKGGGFRLDEGTSFATPVAVSMAALVLAFESQHLCKSNREEAQALVDLDDLRGLPGMVRVLRRISKRVGEDFYYYSYISPELLWTGFTGTPGADRTQMRKYAWDVIVDALRQ